MLSELLLRDYSPEDYERILLLWQETGLGGAQRGDSREVIERSIQMGGRFLVAETREGMLVGTSWITFDGRRLHLHHLSVAKSCRRRGIGHLLATESIRFARKKACQIKLEVHQSNQAAIGLYKKLGFQHLGDYDVYIIRRHQPEEH